MQEEFAEFAVTAAYCDTPRALTQGTHGVTKTKVSSGMKKLTEAQTQAAHGETGGASTFQSIFFRDGKAVPVRVPDYQRAYSWESKQIELFIADLEKYRGVGKGYYFGHFIAEDAGKHWEIVDGQQRITTFVLFLMVCRVLSPSAVPASACTMIEQFSTVGYDEEALKTICRNLGDFLVANGQFDERKPPPDKEIIGGLSLTGAFTRSQRRMVLALFHFYQAFEKKTLGQDKIGDYVATVMTAHCSHHLTPDKSVAVNIFEMQNTRGIPLTTLEIIKAKLMKFVYDHGGEDREAKVRKIQEEFGEIYGMEERVAEDSFRGEMTMEQLLLLHLRAVDDGNKTVAKDFHSPATNATADELVAYVDSRLEESGVPYALKLAKELKKSARIVSEILPAWDKENQLVGDVLILEQDLSCQLFLIICRCLASEPDKADGRIGKDTLLLWERLLFTRDFHGGYYNLKRGKDDFPSLFSSCREKTLVAEVLNGYLADGFRPDRTKGLQSVVVAYLSEHKKWILNQAFFWWKPKMIYAIYKYEISRGANIRDVMKGKISVEHILPQEWQWEWIEGLSGVLGKLSDEEKEKWLKDVGSFINGIGNLLLLTPSENTTEGNKHPADKKYEKYCTGGSYEKHDKNRERWKSSKEWSMLIDERGTEIFNFMLGTLVGAPESPQPSTGDDAGVTHGAGPVGMSFSPEG